MKLIITDLDNTLLRSDKSISPYTATVLKECKEKGIGIIVATARPLRNIKQYFDIIDFDAIVVSTGARVVWNNQREEHCICQKSAEQLLKVLKCHPDFRITLETGDIAYSNKPIEFYETIVCDDLIAVAQKEGALKILVELDSVDTLETVKKHLTDDVYFAVANGHLMQVMSKSATKWNGIKTILDILKCSPNEVIYFGDDYDDIEPIKMCGIGVAVFNAIEEVKAVADYITEDNDNDGVANFIKETLLKND